MASPSSGPEFGSPRPGARARAAARLVSAVEHPADRSDHGRDRSDPRRSPFDRFSERVSFLVSSPLFFAVCALLVLAWVIGLLLGASNRDEAALAGLMSALTLILVATLKNAEQRAERAVQTKLDAIASALLEERRGEDDDAEARLQRSIGLHEQI